MADDAALQAQITQLVEERLDVDVSDPEEDLLEAGVIDSLALVTLIVGLEDTFAVELPLDDFDVERFRSVAAMARFLESVGVVATGPA